MSTPATVGAAPGHGQPGERSTCQILSPRYAPIAVSAGSPRVASAAAAPNAVAAQAKSCHRSNTGPATHQLGCVPTRDASNPMRHMAGAATTTGSGSGGGRPRAMSPPTTELGDSGRRSKSDTLWAAGSGRAATTPRATECSQAVGRTDRPSLLIALRIKRYAALLGTIPIPARRLTSIIYAAIAPASTLTTWNRLRTEKTCGAGRDTQDTRPAATATNGHQRTSGSATGIRGASPAHGSSTSDVALTGPVAPSRLYAVPA